VNLPENNSNDNARTNVESEIDLKFIDEFPAPIEFFEIDDDFLSCLQ